MHEPPNLSNISSSWGMKNRQWMVILLTAWLYIHMRQLSSFFGVKIVSTAHGPILFLICPLCINSSTFSFRTLPPWDSSDSMRFDRLALGIRFIWCCIPFIGGNLSDSSLWIIPLDSSNNIFTFSETSVNGVILWPLKHISILFLLICLEEVELISWQFFCHSNWTYRCSLYFCE